MALNATPVDPPESLEGKPCSKRCENGGWCLLADEHEGECEGIARRYEPCGPPIDRHLMRRETYDPDWDPTTRKKRGSP